MPKRGDRRVMRTQRALIRALVELVLEKRYDAITIQDLLDRADVGRSTFYAHYRGKDHLLDTSFEHMLQMLDGVLDRDPYPHRIAPVRELFDHIGAVKSFHRALARAHMLERIFRNGVVHLARTMTPRVAALPAAQRAGVDAATLAQGYAGALFALLRWWVDAPSPPSPDRMDAMFHALVMPTP